jgi:hypothetical protein
MWSASLSALCLVNGRRTLIQGPQRTGGELFVRVAKAKHQLHQLDKRTCSSVNRSFYLANPMCKSRNEQVQPSVGVDCLEVG